MDPGEQADAQYLANRPDRCFHCKSNLYRVLRAEADRRSIEQIANGTNLDDLGDERPGLRAAEQAGLISPLLEARLGKADVRAVAEYLGLPNAQKPAAACLASRLPFGTQVTPQRLAMVEKAESFLKELGFSGGRVRHHQSMARIELPADQMTRMLEPAVRESVFGRLRELGFMQVTLDLGGYRSGGAHRPVQVRVESNSKK